MIDPPSLLLVARGTIGTKAADQAKRPFWVWFRKTSMLARRRSPIPGPGVIGAEESNGRNCIDGTCDVVGSYVGEGKTIAYGDGDQGGVDGSNGSGKQE